MRSLVENRIQTGSAIAMAVLMFFGSVAWWSADRNLETAHEVEHTHELDHYLEDILVEMLNIETGARGFIISGDEKFLEPYAKGLASVHNSWAAAERMAQEDPAQQKLLGQLQGLIDQKIAFISATIEIRRRDIAAANQLIASGKGKQFMDEIRKVVGELETTENVLLHARLDRLKAEARRTITTVIVSGVVGVVLVGLAGVVARRGFRKRRQAELALQLASERLSLATRAGNVGIWDWNISTGTVFWDDAVYALYGVSRDQFTPTFQSFVNSIHPDDRQRVQEDIQMALRGEKEYASEFRIVWPDKSIHYVQATSAILRDDSGQPCRMLGTNWDVTTRRLAEKKFRDLLEAAPDGMIITNQEGQITLVNVQAEKLFGYSRDELLGRHVESLIPERFRSVHPGHRRDFLVAPHRRPMGAGLDLWALRKDGSEFPVEVSLSPLQTESGMVVIAAVRDITDRARIEEALRQGARQKRQLAEYIEVERARLAEAQAVAKVGSWELDLRTDVLTWSEENYRIFGVEPGKFAACYETFLERIPSEERTAVNKAYSESVASHQPYAIDHRLQMDDGSIKFVYERGQTFYDDQGRPVRSVGTTQDITARKMAEESLRESEDTLRMLAESMPQLVWMCRPDGWNIYFNQRWVEYTGLSLEDSYGHGWNKPFHPDDQLLAWNAWKTATKTGGPYELECRLRSADGSYRWFLIRGVPVRNTAGAIVKWIGTCTDIDHVKKAEEEIRILNTRLAQHSANLEKEVSERTAKLSASIKSLETLTYTMAHDLRAPIRAMIAYADALLEDVPLSDVGKNYAAGIHLAAERMNRLVSDLLDYCQLMHGQFSSQSLDLGAQIRIVLDDWAPKIQKARGEIQVQEPMPVISANEELLGRILSHLLANALKFVGPGVAPKVVFRSEMRGSMVRLWVEDNGIGIAPVYQQKIFGLFYRLHTTEEYPGTGLGLAFAHRAVELMSGRIGVESEVGKGSKFWIELPTARDAVQ